MGFLYALSALNFLDLFLRCVFFLEFAWCFSGFLCSLPLEILLVLVGGGEYWLGGACLLCTVVRWLIGRVFWVEMVFGAVGIRGSRTF